MSLRPQLNPYTDRAIRVDKGPVKLRPALSDLRWRGDSVVLHLNYPTGEVRWNGDEYEAAPWSRFFNALGTTPLGWGPMPRQATDDECAQWRVAYRRFARELLTEIGAHQRPGYAALLERVANDLLPRFPFAFELTGRELIAFIADGARPRWADFTVEDREQELAWSQQDIADWYDLATMDGPDAAAEEMRQRRQERAAFYEARRVRREAVAA